MIIKEMNQCGLCQFNSLRAHEREIGRRSHQGFLSVCTVEVFGVFDIVIIRPHNNAAP